MSRDGGYTRVVRTEPKNTYDQGESAVLELVDGPKDSRFMMTAKALARDRTLGQKSTPLTLQNAQKVTRFRQRGDEALEAMVQRFMALQTRDAAEAPYQEGAEQDSAAPAPARAPARSRRQTR